MVCWRWRAIRGLLCRVRAKRAVRRNGAMVLKEDMAGNANDETCKRESKGWKGAESLGI